MPEAGDSSPKASELYLGIVDLFAVILPGAIIALIIEKGFSLDSQYEWLKGTQGWAIFLAASYIIGHFISALGGLLFDRIYDTGYKISKKQRGYFRIRSRARDLVQSLLKSLYSEKDNAMEWAGIVTRLGSSAASAEIDRLEADSKFFRSFATVLIFGWPIYIVAGARHFRSVNAHDLWTRHLGFLLSVLSLFAVVVLRFYVGRREDRHEKRMAETGKAELPYPFLEDRVTKDLESVQDLAVPCWRATMATAVVWFALVIVSGWLLEPLQAWVGLGCGILAIFSGWRYMERRLKRTRLTYAYTIALSINRLDSIPAGGTGNERFDGG
jgi:hypothetical protein